MSDKITIELTQEQLDNLNTVIELGTGQHQNSDLVKKSFPKELRQGNQYKIPAEEPDEDFLIIMGSIGDRGRYGSGGFTEMFKKFVKSHPEAAKKYLERMFKPAKDRGFYFTADFRKTVARIGLEADVLPDNAKMYYVKTFATKGSNASWVIRNLKEGNMPDKAWDVVARSKRKSVIEFAIRNGPDNVLPLVIGQIPNMVDDSRYSYRRGERLQESKAYLEYMFEHRVDFINGRVDKFNPMNESTYIYKVWRPKQK